MQQHQPCHDSSRCHRRRVAGLSVLLFFSCLLLSFHALAVQSADSTDENNAENKNAYVFREHLVSYPVTGDSIEALRRSIDSYRIVDASGKRHDADTRSNIHWTYTTASDASGCSLVSFHTTLDVQITLPQWQASAYASDELRQHWADYMSALRVHEDGHVQNGRMEAAAIDHLLESVGPHADCGLLDRDVEELTTQIHQQFEMNDIEYDRRTEHGRTQGAIFP